MVLERDGQRVSIAAQSPLLLEPGLWTTEDGFTVAIRPSQSEGRLIAGTAPGATRDVSRAMPQRSATDYGLLIAIFALALLLGEGLRQVVLRGHTAMPGKAPPPTSP